MEELQKLIKTAVFLNEEDKARFLAAMPYMDEVEMAELKNFIEEGNKELDYLKQKFALLKSNLYAEYEPILAGEFKRGKILINSSFESINREKEEKKANELIDKI